MELSGVRSSWLTIRRKERFWSSSAASGDARGAGLLSAAGRIGGNAGFPVQRPALFRLALTILLPPRRAGRLDGFLSPWLSGSLQCRAGGEPPYPGSRGPLSWGRPRASRTRTRDGSWAGPADDRR